LGDAENRAGGLVAVVRLVSELLLHDGNLILGRFCLPRRCQCCGARENGRPQRNPCFCVHESPSRTIMAPDRPARQCGRVALMDKYRTSLTWLLQDSFRADKYDRILGQTANLLAQRGDEEAVALLVDMRPVTIADTGEVVRTERVFLPDIKGAV
jgi:hypothetical protein